MAQNHTRAPAARRLCAMRQYLDELKQPVPANKGTGQIDVALQAACQHKRDGFEGSRTLAMRSAR